MGEGQDQVKAAGESGRERSDEIRDEIDRTRAELDETVDAIGERLRPGRIAEEGWEKVRSSTERGANRVVQIAREHPIPLSLIGVGVTWLMVERARRGHEDAKELEDDYRDLAASAGEYGSTGYEQGRRAKDKLRDSVSAAQDKAAEAKDRIADTASRAANRISDAASRARSGVGRVAGNVRERALDLGRRTSDGAQRARAGFWDLVERRPIAAGAATLAAGLLLGLLIPSTRREDTLMGETRDQMMRGVREAGRETLEKTKEVARSAADAAENAAQGEAQRQKLMPGTA